MATKTEKQTADQKADQEAEGTSDQAVVDPKETEKSDAYGDGNVHAGDDKDVNYGDGDATKDSYNYGDGDATKDSYNDETSVDVDKPSYSEKPEYADQPVEVDKDFEDEKAPPKSDGEPGDRPAVDQDFGSGHQAPEIVDQAVPQWTDPAEEGEWRVERPDIDPEPEGWIDEVQPIRPPGGLGDGGDDVPLDPGPDEMLDLIE